MKNCKKKSNLICTCKRIDSECWGFDKCLAIGAEAILSDYFNQLSHEGIEMSAKITPEIMKYITINLMRISS